MKAIINFLLRRKTKPQTIQESKPLPEFMRRHFAAQNSGTFALDHSRP